MYKRGEELVAELHYWVSAFEALRA
jgi:hypothetical protein